MVVKKLCDLFFIAIANQEQLKFSFKVSSQLFIRMMSRSTVSIFGSTFFRLITNCHQEAEHKRLSFQMTNAVLDVNSKTGWLWQLLDLIKFEEWKTISCNKISTSSISSQPKNEILGLSLLLNIFSNWFLN